MNVERKFIYNIFFYVYCFCRPEQTIHTGKLISTKEVDPKSVQTPITVGDQAKMTRRDFGNGILKSSLAASMSIALIWARVSGRTDPAHKLKIIQLLAVRQLSATNNSRHILQYQSFWCLFGQKKYIKISKISKRFLEKFHTKFCLSWNISVHRYCIKLAKQTKIYLKLFKSSALFRKTLKGQIISKPIVFNQ